MCHRRRVSHIVALAVLLPSLALSPVQAGMWLLHRPCDQSAHYHQLPGANLADWRTDDLCDSHSHRHAPEGDARYDDDSGEHCTRELAVILSKEHLTRSERTESNLIVNLQSSQVCIALLSDDAVAPPSLSSTRQLSPSASNATAELLQRNHALLL